MKILLFAYFLSLNKYQFSQFYEKYIKTTDKNADCC